MIAFRRGSMPELLVDGCTGFLVEDVDEAVAAVDKSTFWIATGFAGRR